MDLLQIGAQLLKNQLSTNTSQDGIAGALGQLLGAQNSDGQIDLAALLGKLASNGNVQQMLGAFLQGKQATNLNASQIIDLFGDSKLGQFAQQLGVSDQDAAGGLAKVLPNLLEQANGQSGAAGMLGGLLKSAGGVGGLLNAFKK